MKKKKRNAVMEHTNTPFPSVAGPWVRLGGSDELFCKKSDSSFQVCGASI